MKSIKEDNNKDHQALSKYIETLKKNNKTLTD